MNGVFLATATRILLRYLAGVLVAKGLLHNPETLLNPDMVQATSIILGAVLSAIAEGWFYLVHKRKRDVERDH